MEALMPGLSAADNIHPMLVHFPIALWVTSLLFWVLGRILKKDALLEAGRWTLWVGTLSAFATIATGFGAANGLGHDSAGHEFVHVHRNWMLASTAAAAVTSVVAYFKQEAWFLLAALLGITVGVTSLGADRGALLVFGYGMGVGSAPVSAGNGGGHSHGGSDTHPTPAATEVSTEDGHVDDGHHDGDHAHEGDHAAAPEPTPDHNADGHTH